MGCMARRWRLHSGSFKRGTWKFYNGNLIVARAQKKNTLYVMHAWLWQTEANVAADTSWWVVAQEARPHESKGIADAGQNGTPVGGKEIYIWINVHVVMRKRGAHVTMGNGLVWFGSRGSWFRIRINIFLNVHIFCIMPNINIDFLAHREQRQKSKVSIYISGFFWWYILFEHRVIKKK